ncbi:MAG: prepilin-type N-terminal cleavage/methylation domain-containing protein [Longimicrobiales bacterium]|nr:prepilin-type N-terminal cleavage/methylation domain-containing protein [Longimicrobiales bacterium]
MSTHRQGFTLIELLLVMVLGLVVLGATYETLIRQEEAYTVYNAMSATQSDTRTGTDLLTGDLREMSAADLTLATPDSLRFRALRKFGLLCDKDKISKKLVLAQMGMEDFAAGDSLIIYVDGDSLKAADDVWEVDYVNNTSLGVACGTTLGINLAGLLPDANLIQVSTGMALRFDSVFPGAPVRSFEVVTYRTGTFDGQPYLVRIQDGAVAPLVGPLASGNPFELRYYDNQGMELTSFPLNAADRAAVARIEVRLAAERQTTQGDSYTDVLVTDVYLRGS